MRVRAEQGTKGSSTRRQKGRRAKKGQRRWGGGGGGVEMKEGKKRCEAPAVSLISELQREGHCNRGSNERSQPDHVPPNGGWPAPAMLYPFHTDIVQLRRGQTGYLTCMQVHPFKRQMAMDPLLTSSSSRNRTIEFRVSAIQVE